MSQQKEFHYQRLFKATPGKVLVLRPTTYEIIAVTDEYLASTMTQESDIVGKSIVEAFPDDPQDPQADGVENLLASLHRAQRLKIPDVMGIQRYPVQRNGSFEERYWSPVNTPVLDDNGDVEFIMHRAEDVTAIMTEGARSAIELTATRQDTQLVQEIVLRSQELRQALLKLQQSEARTRRAERQRLDVLESISDAFFALDTDWHFTYLNQQAGIVLERPVDELLGKHIWDEFPAAVDSLFQTEYQAAAEHQQTRSFKAFYPPLEKWFDVSAYPIPDGLAVYFRDITERLALEQRLRESQKLEAVGHLTGGVAHDFNNLLTVILGNAEMLAEYTTDPTLRPMAEMAVLAAERGAELTSRLLAFARRQPLDPKPTNLNQLIEAIWPLIRRTLPESIELNFVPDTDLDLVEIDASELDSALLNLVVNARDAMFGSGKLTIETANAVLDTDYASMHPEVAPGKYVMICVSDTGAGMSESTLEKAFEPFFTTKALGKGSGLGLSMVFGFTHQSGGHIKLYSEPGDGTSVRLYFPRTADAELTPYQPKAHQKPETGSEHILIAEDDALVRQHLHGQLRSLGYQVTTVDSGPAALKALAEDSTIALLLTDIIMPGGMNGRELAERAQTTYPSLKVLYTSGYTENAIVHHGRLDPGVELLSKPYTRLELATKVRRVISGSMA